MHTHAGLNVSETEPDHCLLAANVTLQGRYSWLD